MRRRAVIWDFGRGQMVKPSKRPCLAMKAGEVRVRSSLISVYIIRPVEVGPERRALDEVRAQPKAKSSSRRRRSSSPKTLKSSRTAFMSKATASKLAEELNLEVKRQTG